MTRTLLHGRRAVVLALLAILMLVPLAARAQVPQTISYQGSLTDSGGAPITGAVSMTFGLYAAASGGTPLWQETQATVAVVNGAFDVVFGADGGNPLDVSLFAGQLYLGITVGADAEMTPRQALTAVSYAIQAKNAETLGGLQSSEIIDAAADEVRTPISSLPFIISAPGSYFVTGELTSAGGGITVNTDNVTIDLMGFSLIGPGAGSGFNDGVSVGTAGNVEIRNGTIRSFGRFGVQGSLGAANARMIGLRIIGNELGGLGMGGGIGHQVIDCLVDGTVNGNGMELGERATVLRSTVSNNLGIGIRATGDATVSGNTVVGNSGNGIQVGLGSVVFGNRVSGSATNGIDAGTGSRVEGNVAYGNGERGIWAKNGTVVAGNSAYVNGTRGIDVFLGAAVRGNTAYFNQNEGIVLSGQNFVDGNTAYNNNQSGGAFPNMSACGTCTFGNNHAP